MAVSSSSPLDRPARDARRLSICTHAPPPQRVQSAKSSTDIRMSGLDDGAGEKRPASSGTDYESVPPHSSAPQRSRELISKRPCISTVPVQANGRREFHTAPIEKSCRRASLPLRFSARPSPGLEVSFSSPHWSAGPGRAAATFLHMSPAPAAGCSPLVQKQSMHPEAPMPARHCMHAVPRLPMQTAPQAAIAAPQATFLKTLQPEGSTACSSR